MIDGSLEVLMRRYGWTRMTALILTLVLLALPCAALAEADDSSYVENSWNFVDGSMDVSAGIPEDAVGVLADIRSRGLLRVATEPYYPPQEFIDPSREGQDRFVGADMELARAIAGAMGVELEIVPMEFTEVLTAVEEQQCDLAISALAYTPGRAAVVELSKGYNFAEENAGSALVIRQSDAGEITGAADLAGRDIVAQSGSLQELLMAENVLDYHEFRRLSGSQEVYDAVISGEADAAMVDVEPALGYIANNPECGLMLLEHRYTLEAEFDGDRVAARKGELQLIYFVNGVIDGLLKSGQYRAWFEEYEALAANLGM